MQGNGNARKRPRVSNDDVIDVDAITIDVDVVQPAERKPIQKPPQEDRIDVAIDLTTPPGAKPPPAPRRRVRSVFDSPPPQPPPPSQPPTQPKPEPPQDDHVDIAIDLTTPPGAKPPPAPRRRIHSIFDTPRPPPSQPPAQPKPPGPSSAGSSSRVPSNRGSSGDLEEEEVTNPSVSVVDLFRRYNHQYFWGSLNGVYVEFSTRMTSCAGTCTFRGRHGGCRIALSEPLLKFRPRSDLLSTLLHEMIHAYLFLKDGIARDGFDGHGPKFLSHAARINSHERASGVLITPYHTFHDEVELYRVHHWTCNKCGKLIKRAMNRAPSKWDTWWAQHVSKCGGAFIKTKEPPAKPKKPSKRKLKAEKEDKNQLRVDDLFKKKEEECVAVKKEEADIKEEKKPNINNNTTLPLLDSKPKLQELLFNKPKKVDCPVCGKSFEERLMNEHLDHCLSVVDEPQPETPLSGRLFKERQHSKGGSSSKGMAPGEYHYYSEGATRDTNIDLVSIGMQKMFGGADTIMASSILDAPVPRVATSCATSNNNNTGLIFELASAADKTVIQPPFSEPSTRDVVNDLKTRLGLIEIPAPTTPQNRLHSHSKRSPYAEVINLEKTTPGKSPFTLAAQGKASQGLRRNSTARRHEWWRPKSSNNDDNINSTGPRRDNGAAKAPAAGGINKQLHLTPSAPVDETSPNTNCPMCTKPFRRADLDNHLTQCLGDIEFEQERPPARTDDVPFRTNNYSNNRAIDYNRAAVPSAAPAVEPARAVMIACPICCIQVRRDELESHTAQCLQNSGFDFS